LHRAGIRRARLGLAAMGLGRQNAAMSAADPAFRSPPALLSLLIGFAVIAVLLQLPLILDPGYFSHDELQWGARADVAAGMPLPWVDWWGWRTFQFRPLTFNGWLLLSHWLFRTPQLFHAVWVALGIGNALMLLRLMLRVRVATVPALLFALGFTLGPFAAFTHGWVATLADLLWVGFGLIMAHMLLWAGNEPARRWPACVGVFVVTMLALLSKESAIVLPALVALAWLLAGRPRILRDAAIASAVPVIIYLALRLNVILYAPRAPGVYGWSLLSIPRQWLLYQLFPLLPSVPEINNVLMISNRRLILACALLLVLAIVVIRANVRAGVLLIVGGAMALGPVLLLETPSNQYGYGLSAVATLALALAWAGLGRVGRALAVLYVLIGAWHGINVQLELQHDGELQARFSPALAQIVATAPRTPVRLLPPDDHGWVFQRIAHDIPSYHGVPIGDRVQLVSAGEPADYLIGPDGSLTKSP
jgi:hypothetical protein